MRYGNIYIIKNKINTKVYIGQTLLDINTRFRLHIEKVKHGRKSKFYNAIRKYGIENFYIELIESNIPLDELNIKEKEYILKYDSINKGYNTNEGGDGRTNYSKIDEDLVLEMVKNKITTKDIAKYLGVSAMTIQRCLISKGIKRYSNINDDLLMSMWKDNTINSLATYFDVNEKTIRRHAKKLGLRKR